MLIGRLCSLLPLRCNAGDGDVNIYVTLALSCTLPVCVVYGFIYFLAVSGDSNCERWEPKFRITDGLEARLGIRWPISHRFVTKLDILSNETVISTVSSATNVCRMMRTMHACLMNDDLHCFNPRGIGANETEILYNKLMSVIVCT